MPIAFAEAIYQFADKTNEGPLRLLSILALCAVVVWRVPRDAAWLNLRWARAITRCGTNSLAIFCLGIFLSVLGHAALVEYGASVANQAVVTAAGCFILLSLAKLFSWYKAHGKPRKGEG